jgi:hypothetical protein
MEQERSVRLAGGMLGPESHIFTEGVDRGEKAVHVVGPEQRHHH